MDQVLKRLQAEQLDILKVIDTFCRENNIRYSLYEGTLLGAVRHRGFIPWDDDLDICMARSDYNRFISTWLESGPDGYTLQNKGNAPRFDQSFTKIRKNHSTYLQKQWEATAFHTGIFVDVFPIDRLPDGKIASLAFTWDCLRYQLYTREFVPPKGSFVQKAISSFLLGITPAKKRCGKRQELLEKITRSNRGKGNTVAIETLYTIKNPLPANLLDEFIRLPFEDGEFMCFKNWDGYLKAKYGDYMTLPPESERTWKHHPILIDFEHDYEELQQQTDTDRLP